MSVDEAIVKRLITSLYGKSNSPVDVVSPREYSRRPCLQSGHNNGLAYAEISVSKQRRPGAASTNSVVRLTSRHRLELKVNPLGKAGQQAALGFHLLCVTYWKVPMEICGVFCGSLVKMSGGNVTLSSLWLS